MASPVKLWNHQQQIVDRATKLPHFAILAEAGTGKTGAMITILRHLYSRNGKLLKTLILCPQIVCENWKREFGVFSNIQDDRIKILRNSGKERSDLFIREAYEPKIWITNYESLLMADLFKQLEAHRFDIIIADESHRIKSPQSKRTKLLLKLGKTSQFRYIMTGTPITKNIMDLYTQFKFLDGGKCFGSFGDNFFAFRNHYFYDRNVRAPAHVTWPEWVLKNGAIEDVQNRISPISVSVKKSDCLDLPPLVRKTIFVDLAPEQAKHYKMMKDHFITYINEKASVATLAITKALRLQQIVSGYIKLENETVVQIKENPRLKALEELLEDLVLAQEKKVIIWACFHENYDQIRDLCEKLKIKAVECHGGISAKEKQESIKRFQSEDDVKVFIGNQGAGGIGVNLVEASYAVYYSRSFSLEHDIQSEARNYRGGSEMHQKVTRIDLVARGTIDEQVLEALASKQEIGEKILKEVALKL